MRNSLSVEKEIEVRFNEVDLYNIVWHGNYAIYLEAGRQAFSNKYGLGQREMLEQGYYLPLVKLDIDYKKILVYNDMITVVTRYTDCQQAKILFDYEVYRDADKALICKARTEQVIVGLDWNLKLFPPAYFLAWKEKWLGTYADSTMQKV